MNQVISKPVTYENNPLHQNLLFLYSIVLSTNTTTSNFSQFDWIYVVLTYILLTFRVCIIQCSWFNIVWKRFDIRFVNIKIQFMHTFESLYYYLNGGLDK